MSFSWLFERPLWPSCAELLAARGGGAATVPARRSSPRGGGETLAVAASARPATTAGIGFGA
uniref:Uncharacterized protein n=1 Tax=Zea mays TaxID=4577 RepID=B6U5C4_MAIZE|nr:hypothetical protein [Zea mays]